MDLDPVFLSRLQFAFVVSFHIIFPAFTIGLAAWLATIEGAHLFTRREVYRRVFDFWLKVFAVSFGMGVVTGIVMAFQFGTNWGVLSERMGSIQGPLLGYEGFTAFMLEATFFGVMLLGRDRVSPGFYFFACCMVALGTMFSSFWILANNSWMQVPVGYSLVDGRIVPADWWSITTGAVMRVRWPHMLLAAFLTTSMCVAATGAWYVLRGVHRAEARVMLHWGLGLAAVLIPAQLLLGHLTGLYLYKHQPAKLAAIEARWHFEQPGNEVWLAWPDEKGERNLFAIQTAGVGSLIDTGDWNAPMPGLTDFPVEDRPPVLIPFFTFRIMVGMGLVMLAVSWFGNLLRLRGRLETTRWFLRAAFLAFPTGFIATLAGWYTAEVGRQPWVVYGLLRTSEAVTPSLRGSDVLFSLIVYIVVYATFVSFGIHYIYKLLREGPTTSARAIPGTTPNRPLAYGGAADSATGVSARGPL
ncbi:MAG: cytochrome ubiquinol oxidase subunit I [Burkholderiales bacterium]